MVFVSFPAGEGQRDGELRFGHGGQVGQQKLPAGNFSAVLPQHRFTAEIPAPLGHCPVFEDETEVGGGGIPGGKILRLLQPDRAVGLFDFVSHRFPGEVGLDDAVIGHIGRVLPFYHRLAEIPAVSEELFPVRCFPHQGFVLPIPDVAALEPGIPFQELPEFFHPAAAVADLV